jgi:hypothetical protein
MIGKNGLIGAVFAAMEQEVFLSAHRGQRRANPSGSPKRNQERSIKRQAQRSRVINRMRRK